jgi:hypothetical protein
MVQDPAPAMGAGDPLTMRRHRRAWERTDAMVLLTRQAMARAGLPVASVADTPERLVWTPHGPEEGMGSWRFSS